MKNKKTVYVLNFVQPIWTKKLEVCVQYANYIKVMQWFDKLLIFLHQLGEVFQQLLEEKESLIKAYVSVLL